LNGRLIGPRVTIGLPFRNNARTIELAVRSIFAQTFLDWELILIDDGSTDGSAELMQSIDDRRVRLHRDGQNLGLPARLNQITALARGAYVARMDADDVMHPDRIRRQVEMLDAHPHIDLLATAAYVIDDSGTVTAVASAAPYCADPAAFLTNHHFIHPTIMARHAWWMKNPYDVRYRRGQDKELWCRTNRTSEFAKLTEPLLFFRDYKAFSFQTYRLTKQFDRDIITRYGPPIVGSARTRVMAEKTRAKVALYGFLRAFRLESLLLKQRYEPISDARRVVARAELERVAAVALPRRQRDAAAVSPPAVRFRA
jgi:glycosyltransferase involved in cell wall biosynthesis